MYIQVNISRRLTLIYSSILMLVFLTNSLAETLFHLPASFDRILATNGFIRYTHILASLIKCTVIKFLLYIFIGIFITWSSSLRSCHQRMWKLPDLYVKHPPNLSHLDTWPLDLECIVDVYINACSRCCSHYMLVWGVCSVADSPNIVNFDRCGPYQLSIQLKHFQLPYTSFYS